MRAICLLNEWGRALRADRCYTDAGRPPGFPQRPFWFKHPFRRAGLGRAHADDRRRVYDAFFYARFRELNA